MAAFTLTACALACSHNPPFTKVSSPAGAIVSTPSHRLFHQPSECENSKECSPAKHHFLECQERVEAGNGFKDENCVEEL